ncbi:MAG TPA: hypothetical protein VMT30_02395 [Candidatus Saccharimonadia bacterium]|nr:hypothetical protein [Candidatus Saccharimonadia bacterium]
MTEVLCDLRVEKEGNLFVVRDQEGRKVRGVRAIAINQRMNDVTTITLEFIQYKSGKPEVAR